MRPIQVDISFEDMEGKQSCDVRLIQHRDKTESLICRTVMENGRKVKMIALLRPLPKKDCYGHGWHVSCLSMSTHAYDDKRRWFDAIDMFRFWLTVFTGMIRKEKVKAEVKV